MSTIDTPSGNESDQPHVHARVADGIEIRMLRTADEMAEVGAVFQQVWGSTTELIRLEMLMAIAHSGGYVAAPYDMTRGGDHGMILGASVALLAEHQGQPAMHSHVTGILPGARSTGLGRELKMHQRAWAIERGLEWIVWTYDPLVRRNAWFNIAVLGAEVHGYLESFYGTMTDAINAGDISDRLLVAWNVGSDPEAPARDGSGLAERADHVLIPTPDDIVALRRTDPADVDRWRTDTRAALTRALDEGREIVGFTREGAYVAGPPATQTGADT
jgi:predicted GNAT superfamily acetyltransferase